MIFFFNDTAPTEIYTLSLHDALPIYNVIDGLFKQIFAEIGTGDENYIEITENGGISYATQALPQDATLGYLTQAVNAADSRLLDDQMATFTISRSIADNYRDTWRTKTLGTGFLEVTENGKTKLIFDGYPLKVKSGWDRTIKSVQNNGTKWNLPHRFVFTTKENLPVATLSQDDLSTLDSFYDQYRKANITDVVFSLDTKHLQKYKTVAAY